MKRPQSFLGKVFAFLGSFGLACVLLGLLFLLTLFGTLAQVDRGLYEAQKLYFESWWVVDRVYDKIPVVLPGAVPVMALFTLNLLVGGLVRMRKNARTAGIVIAHIGILWMMAAALVKFQASHDGHLRLAEGESSDEFVSYFDWEIAIWPVRRGDEGAPLVEHVIEHGELAAVRKGGTATFRGGDLPFALTVSRWEKNARAVPKGPMFEAPHPVLDGWTLLPRPLETQAEANIAGCYVDVVAESGGEPQRGFLFGAESYPWTFEAGGRTYAMTLRHSRYPMGFTIRLEKFTHEKHPRTGIPKVFSSRVTRIENGLESPVDISMNEPLRHGGLVLFQSQYEERPRVTYSIFSVVRNPSDHWPLYSCIVIGVGLSLAFGQRLVAWVRAQRKHLEKRAAAAPAS